MGTKMKFVAGIDGGGTKTTVICRNLNGQIVAEKKFGPFNLNSIGEEKFKLLMKQIGRFLNSLGDCCSLCIGAAGLSNLKLKPLIELAMVKAGIPNWQLVGDNEIALWGALEGRPGLSLISGTGSICFGRNADGVTARAGGWGHLIGDEGSGYAIGRDALKAIVRFWDGCAEETSLAAAVAEKLEIDTSSKMITYIYGNDKSSVAVVSNIVEEEARRGDRVAKKILTDNAKQVTELIMAVAKRLNMQNGEVALLGGLLENETVFRKCLIKDIEERCPGFFGVAPAHNAAMGAVMMAAKFYEDHLKSTAVELREEKHMSTLNFTKIQIPAAHLAKSADYPILFTGKRFYKDSSLDEDDGLFLNYGYVQNGLPYTAQDSYDRAEELQEFDAAILENDYLKATFLPGVGGKLWSLYDKRKKRDLIVENPVFRPCNLAIRNAWTAGGVEWNCGVRGHNPLTCDNVFAASYVGADGTPVLRLYAFERIRAVTYQMDFYLPEKSPFLYARMRIVNGADKPVPMYWWSNIAVLQEEGARVVVPADETYVNHAMDPVYKIPIPMVNGVDQSYPVNHVETIDHFYKIPEDSRKFEAHIRKDGTGIIHASTRRLKGRKMFVWGTSVGGENWQQFLTNENGQPYVEIQAGLAYTQNECLMFPGHTAWEWLEAYGAIEMDPEEVHGEYRESRKNVEKWLDNWLPEIELEDFLKRTREDALKPAEPVLYGEAWGTLDNEIKEKRGSKKTAPYLEFGPLGEEQMLWYRLLTTGKFDEPSPKEAPVSFMVQDEWFELLKKCVKENDQDNWYAWYHLGLCWFAREDYERAEECFEKSITLKESTWGYHGIANVAEAEGDYRKASEFLKKAFLLNSENVTIAKEAAKNAFLAEDYDLVKEIVHKMETICPEDGILKCNYAMALAHTGQLEEAKRIFETYGDEAVVDRREGADGITDEYIYVLKELAKRDGHPLAEDEDVEIPYHIDYRMYHTRLPK